MKKKAFGKRALAWLCIIMMLVMMLPLSGFSAGDSGAVEVSAPFLLSDSTGDENTGDENTGDENTGDENTGDENTGDENTGDENTGDENTGDENTGDENTGDENTGDENTGDENTGDENTGDENTGDENTGDESTGDENTGDVISYTVTYEDCENLVAGEYPSVAYGSGYVYTFTAAEGYTLSGVSASVKIGEAEPVSYALNNGMLAIGGGDITGDIVITIKAVSATYDVTVNGEVTADVTEATYNTELVVKMEAKAHYNLSALQDESIEVKVGETALEKATEEQTGYSWEMDEDDRLVITIPAEFVNDAITIEVTAAADVYTITNEMKHVSVDKTAVSYTTDETTVTLTVDGGYTLPAAVKVNGEEYILDETHTVDLGVVGENITLEGDVTLNIADNYAISGSANDKGWYQAVSVIPASPATAISLNGGAFGPEQVIPEGEAEYSIAVQDEDGCVSESKTLQLKVDDTDPVIGVAEYSVFEYDGYYYAKDKVTVTFPITEENLDTNATKATTMVGEEETTLTISYEDDNAASVTLDQSVLGDGKFSVKLTAVDLAGNEVSKTSGFVVLDTTPPANIEISYESDGTVTLKDWFYNIIGKDKEKVTVTVKASDNLSPITKFELYDGETLIKEITEINALGEASVELPAEFKYELTVKAYNILGDYGVLSADKANEGKTNLLLDKTAPTVKFAEDTDYNTVHSTGYTLTVSVSDGDEALSSGLKSIEYTIFDGEVKKDNGELYKSSDDLYAVTKTITIPAELNSNNVTVEIKATDNSGNPNVVTTKAFKMDNEPAKVSVDYGSEDPKPVNGNWYKAPRTATITVVDNNFDPEKGAVITTTGEIGKWGVDENGNAVCEIVFNRSDAPHSLALKITDDGGNRIIIDENEFYVDMTPPVATVTVTADATENEKSASENNHNDPIVVDLEVTDNYPLRPQDVVVKINDAVISNDNAWYTKNWPIDESKELTAQITIPATNDTNSKYIVSVDVVDKANNPDDDASAEQTLDNTDPTDLAYVIEGTYENSKIINKILYGVYADEVMTIKLTAKDNLSGVREFDLMVDEETVKDWNGANKIAGNYEAIPVGEIFESKTININADYAGQLSFTATDHAGNTSGSVGGLDDNANGNIFLDNTAPVVTVTVDADETADNGDTLAKESVVANYHNENLVFHLSVVDEGIPDDGEGLVYTVTKDNKEITAGFTAAAWTKGTTKNGETEWTSTITVEAIEANEGEYAVKAEATDAAGNYHSDEVIGQYLDVTEATITVIPVKDSVTNNDKEATENNHNDSIVYELTVEDNYPLDSERMVITVNDKVIDEAYAENIGISQAWNDGMTKLTATVTIDDSCADDVYKLCVYAADRSGNIKDGTCDAQTLDNTDPEDLAFVIEGTYKNSKIINKILYGVYADEVMTIKLTAKDNLSRVREFDLMVDEETVKDWNGANKIAGNYEAIPVGEIFESKTININADYAGQLSFKATDNAGNTSDSIGGDNENSTGGNIFLDNTAPVVTVTVDADETADNGDTLAKESVVANYHNENLVFHLSVVDEGIPDDGEGLVYTVTKDNKEITAGFTAAAWTKGTTENGETEWTSTITVEAIEANEGEYAVKAEATDAAGNYHSAEVTGQYLDVTKATITVIPVKDSVTNNDKEATENNHNDSIVYELTVEDNYPLDSERMVITVNDKVIDEAYAENIGISQAWNDGMTKLTATVTIDDSCADDVYKLCVYAADRSGNIKDGTCDAQTLDNTDPEDLTYEITGECKNSKVWNYIKYGIYADEVVTIKLTAKDNLSGVREFDLSVADGEIDASLSKIAGNYMASEVDGVFKSQEIPVKPQYLGQLIFTATDHAGNTSEAIGGDDGNKTGGNVIVDNVAPTLEFNTYDFDTVYSSDLTISLKSVSDIPEAANDVSSGLASVTYAIYAKDQRENNDQGETVLYTGNVKIQKVENTDPNDYPVEKVWNEKLDVTIPAKINSNLVYVVYTVKDNAGNSATFSTEDLGYFKMDTIPPAITVVDGNEPVYNYKYFNVTREATITVMDRNFSAAQTYIDTEGVKGSWDSGVDSNSDGLADTYTYHVYYRTDGDYSLTVRSTDLGGNATADSAVDYSGFTAPKDFTIDLTKPVAEITFRDAEGNAVPSEGYANSAVTATITITEHNFDSNSASNGITITKDGASYPASVSWASSGDVHTATITFADDAYYTFNMSFVDMANNQCEPFAQVGFYVDSNMPEIVVGGIEHNSANNAAVISPVITVTDKYYDPDGVVISLIGAKNGDISGSCSVTNVENGQQFSFANIALDDVYTLKVSATDLAGNTIEDMEVELSGLTTDAVIFSVNRDGSTYSASDDLQDLLDEYYTNEAQDLVIDVYNVDKIEDFVITVSRGLTDSEELVEDVDYSVEELPITGGYHYIVTIFKEVFDEDGAYAISMYTEDKAGNTSTNQTAANDATVDIQFYLDTVAPSIVLSELNESPAYAYERYEGGSVIVTDTTLSEIVVTLTYLRTGEVITYRWSEEEIYAEAFTGRFDALLSGERGIDEGGRIRINVTATDKAGNVMYGPTEEVTDEDGNTVVVVDEDYVITVSTNLLIRFYTSKGLFYGSIAGVTAIAVGLIALIVAKKRKGEDKK